ncbi:MAG: hypothetical protein ACJ78I_03775 [Gemmatimonadaceae bacterium]
MRSKWTFRASGHVAVLVLSCVFSARESLAQNNWNRYKPGTLAAVIQEADSEIRAAIKEAGPAISANDKRPSNHFLGYDYPTIATVIYVGDSRPVDPVRRELIAAWGRTYQSDSSIVDDFHREYLFREGDKLLWLPVQDRVAEFFPKELRRGQRVSLFVTLFAGQFANGSITWAFGVNEFRSQPIETQATKQKSRVS